MNVVLKFSHIRNRHFLQTTHYSFVFVSSALGTCAGYLASGVEGLYIAGELGGWVLLLVDLGGAVLRRRMPYLWTSRGRMQSTLYLGFGALIIVYLAVFWLLSRGSPPTCATLPSERLWLWLGGLIPW